MRKMLSPRGASPTERFWDRVERTDSCWNWLGSRNDKGYPTLPVGNPRRTLLAHRFSYELLVGPIPDRETLDHLCRNKRCVNPAHLEPVTLVENIHRAAPFRPIKTHCKHGHEMTEENTRLRDGQRICRACGRRRINSFRQRRAA